MSESKHTPGPWVVAPERDWQPAVFQESDTPASEEDGAVYVETGAESIIVPIRCDHAPMYAHESIALAKANAALIAAAPDMYEALQAAAAFAELYTAGGVRAPAPEWASDYGNELTAQTIADAARAALAKAEGR